MQKFSDWLGGRCDFPPRGMRYDDYILAHIDAVKDYMDELVTSSGEYSLMRAMIEGEVRKQVAEEIRARKIVEPDLIKYNDVLESAAQAIEMKE